MLAVKSKTTKHVPGLEILYTGRRNQVKWATKSYEGIWEANSKTQPEKPSMPIDARSKMKTREGVAYLDDAQEDTMMELTELHAIVFQWSLDEGCLPQSWTMPTWQPYSRRGRSQHLGNYCPVSLTSIVCKVMESLVRDQVVDHMATNQLYTDNQHGFLNGRSCTTNLLAVLDAWSLWSTKL